MRSSRQTTVPRRPRRLACGVLATVAAMAVASAPAPADSPAPDAPANNPAPATPANSPAPDAPANSPAPAAPATPAESKAALARSVDYLNALLAKSPNIVVAEVAGYPITRGDVAQSLTNFPPNGERLTPKAAYDDAVRRLVFQHALALRARADGIDKEPDVQRRIEAFADTLLADEYVSRAAAGMVTDAMAHDLYDRTIAKEPGPESVDARMIFVPTQEQARAVTKALEGGMDFAQAAVKFSQDATAQAGGDLGYVRPGTVAPELATVIFALAPGQTTEYPIRTGSGWYFVKVEARRQEPPPSFDSVRGALIQQLSRTAVRGVVQQAMSGLDVHDYGINGKLAGSGSPPPPAAHP